MSYSLTTLPELQTTMRPRAFKASSAWYCKTHGMLFKRKSIASCLFLYFCFWALLRVKWVFFLMSRMRSRGLHLCISKSPSITAISCCIGLGIAIGYLIHYGFAVLDGITLVGVCDASRQVEHCSCGHSITEKEGSVFA